MVDLTTINWQAVLPNLGVDPKLIENPKRQGPCPMCGGVTRFRLTDYKKSATGSVMAVALAMASASFLSCIMSHTKRLSR